MRILANGNKNCWGNEPTIGVCHSFGWFTVSDIEEKKYYIGSKSNEKHLPSKMVILNEISLLNTICVIILLIVLQNLPSSTIISSRLVEKC